MYSFKLQRNKLVGAIIVSIIIILFVTVIALSTTRPEATPLAAQASVGEHVNATATPFTRTFTATNHPTTMTTTTAPFKDEYIGNGFYIPEQDLLGETLVSGYPVLNFDHTRCIVEKYLSKTDSHQTYYETTETLYSYLGVDVGLSAIFREDFTLGFTLDIVTKSISGQTNEFSGLTFNNFAYTKVRALDQVCLPEVDLSETFASEFEQLPNKIDRPWLTSSWDEYYHFFKTFGSHVITDVYYGSSLYQHAFARMSLEYTNRMFQIEVCAALSGFLKLLHVSICNGVTKEDISSIDKLEFSTTFVARGGSRATRAQLYHNRSDELIEEFLKEANVSDTPVLNKFIPIWDILDMKYGNTKHANKVINLKAYYLGFRNFDCPYLTSGDRELQKFRMFESAPNEPTYQCVIPIEGCQTDDDCRYNTNPFRPGKCFCKKNACIKHKTEIEDTGEDREVPYIQKSDYFHGNCAHSHKKCRCTESDEWQVIWDLDRAFVNA